MADGSDFVQMPPPVTRKVHWVQVRHVTTEAAVLVMAVVLKAVSSRDDTRLRQVLVLGE